MLCKPPKKISEEKTDAKIVKNAHKTEEFKEVKKSRSSRSLMT